MERHPSIIVEKPPREVLELPRKGARHWQAVATATRDLCERAVRAIRLRAKTTRSMIKPAFTAYDRHNNGHVSRGQMRQCLVSYGLLLSDEELYALEQRYNDDLGFNYFWFLKDVEAKEFEEPLYESFVAEMKKINAPRKPGKPANRETDIVKVLAKVKGKVSHH